MSAATYAGATEALIGFVPGRLSFRLTLLAQLAGSFVTLVTPAAVGGATLNIRYLQRQDISAAVAAASVGMAQVVAFVLHVLLIIVFTAIAGGSGSEPVRPPRWAWFVLAGLVLIALVLLVIPAGRRMLRTRLSPMLGQVLPRLLQVAQQPGKLARGIGGTLLLRLSYIFCLAACVAAFSRSVPIAEIGVVYLTGSAIGSIMPTPGGLGAVEAALTRRAHRRGRAGRGRGQRGAAVPAGDVLASRPVRLGGPEVPGARAGPVSPGPAPGPAGRRRRGPSALDLRLCPADRGPHPIPFTSEEIMPTIRESQAKLSASMAELSRRAKEAAEHTAAARDETREQLEARAAEARAAAQRRSEELKAHGAKMKDDLASAWAGLRSHVQEQFEKIRARLGEKRDDLDAQAAERRAERAEANAADAIDFAGYAVDEAEAAALEAAEARMTADAKARSGS